MGRRWPLFLLPERHHLVERNPRAPRARQVEGLEVAFGDPALHRPRRDAHQAGDLADGHGVGEIDWTAVQTRDWRGCKDGKQAEFLLEHSFPWTLVERIGVHTMATYRKVMPALPAAGHRPRVEVIDDWYY